MGLGCARHTAAIYDRGGRQRLGVVDPLTDVDWGRVRDDMSMASVSTSQPSWECQKLLNRVEPNRHELVVFRDNERVWEGPISLITWTASGVSIQARDVMYYAHRTIMRKAHNNNFPNVVTVVDRAESILNTELVRKEALSPPINVLPYLVTYQGLDPAMTAKSTPAYSSLVYEEIDELAARAGLDYTVVGRSIILFDRHVQFSVTPAISQDDFIGDILLSAYGMEGATYAAVTDGQGNWGEVGGVDPYYGEWEILDTAYQEQSGNPYEAPTVPTPPTTGEMASQAQRNLNGRNPVPIIVRVPDGSQLNPAGVLRMEHLVPGIRIPLVATLAGRTFSQMQKLDNVRVKESASDGETISVTMSPASADDVAPEE